MRETKEDATYRAWWDFEEGPGTEDVVYIKVRISAVGVDNLVRRGMLVPSPASGSWRFYEDMPKKMCDSDGTILFQVTPQK